MRPTMTARMLAMRACIVRVRLHRKGWSMLKNLVVSLVVMAAAFAITAWLLNGMEISGGFFSYLWIAAVFGIVNAIVGTILRILTFPLIILTFGLFAVIVNALLLELTDAITSDLTIDDFF